MMTQFLVKHGSNWLETSGALPPVPCSSGRCWILLHKCSLILFVSGSASGLDVYHGGFKTNEVLGVGGVI